MGSSRLDLAALTAALLALAGALWWAAASPASESVLGGSLTVWRDDPTSDAPSEVWAAGPLLLVGDPEPLSSPEASFSGHIYELAVITGTLAHTADIATITSAFSYHWSDAHDPGVCDWCPQQEIDRDR